MQIFAPVLPEQMNTASCARMVNDFLSFLLCGQDSMTTYKQPAIPNSAR